MTPFDESLEYEKKGHYAKAFELLQKCLGNEKYDQGEIHFHSGWCCEIDPNGDKRKALFFYQRAGALGRTVPLRANSFFRSGWLLMHEKDYTGAALHFKKAVDCAEEADFLAELYHHAVYWFAVCLEVHSQYIEALKWFRKVEEIAPLLAPESRFRQILCLNQIGLYEEALKVCFAFENSPPPGFLEQRYGELRAAAQRERTLLERVLAVNPLSPPGWS